MKRVLYTILFCAAVYAFSLLALAVLLPMLDRAPALAGGAPGAGLPLTAALPALHSTTPAFGHTATAPLGRSPIPSAAGAGFTGLLWLLPLPPDLLVIALFLRGLLRNRRAYGVVSAWRVS